MKTEHSAMHNQMNCWPVKSSPTKLSHQTYSQRPAVNAINNQIQNQMNSANQQQIVSQPNRVNLQLNHQISQINSSPHGSFSSDQSTVNLSAAYLSDYSFGSSSTGSNSSGNNLVTSTMSKQLMNQVPVVGSRQIVEPQIKSEQQFSNKSSVQLNQTSARVQNLPLCFNGLPTPGIGSKRKGAKQSNYKHVPHKDKPKHLVDKRNARERNRVKQVNDAFSMLRRYIPIPNKNKRVSKVKTLQRAIEHIHNLVNKLNDLNQLTGSADEPTSTTQLDFKLDDEDTENSFFDNDFLDETSQQSSGNQVIDPTGQFANASSGQCPSTNSVESNQSSDTNNNLIHSNAGQTQQLVGQSHLSFNNSFNFAAAGQNLVDYSIMNSTISNSSISNSTASNQIRNLVIKEDLLYQTATSNCNAVYNAYAEFGN